MLSAIRKLQGMREDELFVAAKELQAPYELVKQVAADGTLAQNITAGLQHCAAAELEVARSLVETENRVRAQAGERLIGKSQLGA